MAVRLASTAGQTTSQTSTSRAGPATLSVFYDAPIVHATQARAKLALAEAGRPGYRLLTRRCGAKPRYVRVRMYVHDFDVQVMVCGLTTALLSTNDLIVDLKNVYIKRASFMYLF